MNNGEFVFTPSSASTEGMKELKPEITPTCTVYGNIEYIERDDKKLHLQIIRPFPSNDAPLKKLPLIVFVQGSAWRRQNVYMNIPQLSRFAVRSFVIAIVEYRESDIRGFPAQVQDCKTAIRFLKANAEQYGIDSDNIALWGDSSGGHTVLLAGITADGVLDTADFGEYSCKVNCIVNYYGPVDIAKMGDYPSVIDHISADSPEGYLLGKVPVLENLDKAWGTCPAAYISGDKSCPPILTIHGDSDKIVPFEQSIIIHEALMKAGKHSEFYKLMGADHGTGEFWSDETYDIVEEFIRRFNFK